MAQHAGETEEQAKAAKTVRKTGGKIGRNDMCPCGSGKKFKFCHEGREGELFALLQGRGTAGAPAAGIDLGPARDRPGRRAEAGRRGAART